MNIIIPVTLPSLNNLIPLFNDFFSTQLDFKRHPSINQSMFLFGEDMPDVRNLQKLFKGSFFYSKIMIVPGSHNTPGILALRSAGMINNDKETLVVDTDELVAHDESIYPNLFQKINDLQKIHDVSVLTIGQTPSGITWWKQGKDFIKSATLMVKEKQYKISSVVNYFDKSVENLSIF